VRFADSGHKRRFPHAPTIRVRQLAKGTKSRKLERRGCGWRYGDIMRRGTVFQARFSVGSFFPCFPCFFGFSFVSTAPPAFPSPPDRRFRTPARAESFCPRFWPSLHHRGTLRRFPGRVLGHFEHSGRRDELRHGRATLCFCRSLVDVAAFLPFFSGVLGDARRWRGSARCPCRGARSHQLISGSSVPACHSAACMDDRAGRTGSSFDKRQTGWARSGRIPITSHTSDRPTPTRRSVVTVRCARTSVVTGWRACPLAARGHCSKEAPQALSPNLRAIQQTIMIRRIRPRLPCSSLHKPRVSALWLVFEPSQAAWDLVSPPHYLPRPLARKIPWDRSTSSRLFRETRFARPRKAAHLPPVCRIGR